MAKILVIDDERSIRAVLKEILMDDEHHQVEEAIDGFEGLNLFTSNDYDLVISDVRMPKIDGLEFLKKANALKPNIPIIILSANANVDLAIDAVKQGAFDYLAKPPNLNKLLQMVRAALEKEGTPTFKANLANPNTKPNNSGIQEMIGDGKELSIIKQTIEKVAPTNARVLISGENGSGKELVAQWLHAKSNRSNGPFIEVNCAAIPTELIESELFGHEKGSFTSAVKQRIGKFESASGGTLFLDEIGDMSLNAQAKVLRALQEGKITRVGGEKDIAVDVRVIVATNKDLLAEVANKNFRLDLYHRLSVIVIKVPSLNNRREDIPELVDVFLNKACKDLGMKLKEIDADALMALQQKNWSGNIRELSNVVERLVILSEDNITLKNVQQYVD
jgi:two-component system, NtrC family, nitrogen regulation response regulator NtrX